MQRFTTGEPLPSFYCVEHSRAGDEAIPDDAIFRLVAVTLEVRMCGTGRTPGIAHAEAIAQLERALEAAGGVINLHACRSLLARQEPRPWVGPQPPGRPRAN